MYIYVCVYYLCTYMCIYKIYLNVHIYFFKKLYAYIKHKFFEKYSIFTEFHIDIWIVLLNECTAVPLISLCRCKQ